MNLSFRAALAAAAMVTTLYAPGGAARELTGVFSGTMDLIDGFERSVPLSVSLVITGETIIDENGEERKVIDGAFVVDEEGGPYSFTTVTFSIEDSKIDLSYERPQLNFGTVPSSFRLVGFYDQNFQISGRAFSGNRGYIGTFVLEPSDTQTLPIRRKYSGYWQGIADLSSGGTVPMRIVLQDALTSFTNPPEYEFDYTPGKVAYVKWNHTKIAINKVAIDYLRRRVVLFKTSSTGVPELSIDFGMDFHSSGIEGAINSVFRGRTATFTLESYNNDQ